MYPEKYKLLYEAQYRLKDRRTNGMRQKPMKMKVYSFKMIQAIVDTTGLARKAAAFSFRAKRLST